MAYIKEGGSNTRDLITVMSGTTLMLNSLAMESLLRSLLKIFFRPSTMHFCLSLGGTAVRLIMAAVCTSVSFLLLGQACALIAVNSMGKYTVPLMLPTCIQGSNGNWS